MRIAGASNTTVVGKEMFEGQALPIDVFGASPDHRRHITKKLKPFA